MPLGTSATSRRKRAAGAHAVQHVSGRRDQRQHAAGVSTGQAIAVMEKIAERGAAGLDVVRMDGDDLPGATVEQHRHDHLSPSSVMFVFLVLAGAIRKLVAAAGRDSGRADVRPGSIAGVTWPSMDINIFTQIGFVVLVGLASKNAILIVEFAKDQQRGEGKSAATPTLEACQLRLRPIMMTSFAFILGAVPLVVATGAGARMRRALGTAVFSGMLGVTLFGIFLTPVFFCSSIGWAATVRLYRVACARRPESVLSRMAA